MHTFSLWAHACTNKRSIIIIGFYLPSLLLLCFPCCLFIYWRPIWCVVVFVLYFFIFHFLFCLLFYDFMQRPQSQPNQTKLSIAYYITEHCVRTNNHNRNSFNMILGQILRTPNIHANMIILQIQALRHMRRYKVYWMNTAQRYMKYMYAVYFCAQKQSIRSVAFSLSFSLFLSEYFV